MAKKHVRTECHVELPPSGDATEEKSPPESNQTTRGQSPEQKEYKAGYKNNIIQPLQWHRLVLTVDTAHAEVKTYVDGYPATSCYNPRRITKTSEFALKSPWLVVSGDAPSAGALIRNVQLIQAALGPEDVQILGSCNEPLFHQD